MAHCLTIDSCGKSQGNQQKQFHFSEVFFRPKLYSEFWENDLFEENSLFLYFLCLTLILLSINIIILKPSIDKMPKIMCNDKSAFFYGLLSSKNIKYELRNSRIWELCKFMSKAHIFHFYLVFSSTLSWWYLMFCLKVI